VARETTSGALVARSRRAARVLVQGVELFDLYTGDKLGAGKKSLAYHVHLASDQKTLSESEVQKFLERLERELGRSAPSCARSERASFARMKAVPPHSRRAMNTSVVRARERFVEWNARPGAARGARPDEERPPRQA
jgi:hypothetical protein